jgi:hypothetical protein
MYKVFVIGLTSLALAGCIAVWGRAYEIQSESPDSVVLEYDSTFIDKADILAVARGSCEKRNRDAVIQSEETSIWNITTVSVGCAERK